MEEEATEAVVIDTTQEVTQEDPQQKTQERPEWLPEKFTDPEAMAKAYGELEKKLSQPKDKPDTLKIDQKEAEVELPTGDPKTVLGDELFGRIEEHYGENGNLTEELYGELQEAGLNRSVVDSYIEGHALRTQRYEEEVTSVVGGKETYQQLQEWAVENLSDSEKDTVNEAVSSGNPAKAQMAVNWLKGRFESSEGSEPNLIEGEGSVTTTSGKAFTSRDEYVHAISDPKYKSDPKYAREVDLMLERSTYWQ
jgi:hypothetical protein